MISISQIAKPFVVLLFFVATFSSDATPRHDRVASSQSSTSEASPSWPPPLRAPQGAPNIVLILLDDVGFGDTSTFGGPAETPALDALAANGLRYNRFHTTGLCAPTRAALLSGRNAHRMGFGTIGSVGFPGYNGYWKDSTVSVAEVLRRNGYSTAAFGKWHNTALEERSPIGPFDRWPTGLGFEYFYGSLDGSTSQWAPSLWRNTLRVAPPRTPEQGYHYTTDIVDEAILWMQTQRVEAPNRPYFIYLATNGAHAPHHVPREWITRYRGRFYQGWEGLRQETFARQRSLGVIPAGAELTPFPADLPSWGDLPPRAQRAAAEQMEVYAAFISHTDYEIGRLINAVHAAPGGENTLILYVVGDNGAAAEAVEGIHVRTSDPPPPWNYLGGPAYGYNLYAAGWAIAGSTPFRGSKGVASYFGGTRNPLVVSWPGHVAEPGHLRSQFTHVNDVTATIYDLVGIDLPRTVDGVRQVPLDGVSFADSLLNPDAPSHRRPQYFETWGNRAIYHDGWVAAAYHRPPWEATTAAFFDNLDAPETYADDVWELYNLETDFSQAHDLAAQYPQRLRTMRALFEREARVNGVYPMISNNICSAPTVADLDGNHASPVRNVRPCREPPTQWMFPLSAAPRDTDE